MRLARPRRLGFIFRLSLVLLAVASPYGAIAALDINDPVLRLERQELENGLTVLLLEDHATPVVSFQVWVKAGSKDGQKISFSMQHRTAVI